MTWQPGQIIYVVVSYNGIALPWIEERVFIEDRLDGIYAKRPLYPGGECLLRDRCFASEEEARSLVVQLCKKNRDKVRRDLKKLDQVIAGEPVKVEKRKGWR
jgi:hypothetical protein